MSQTFCVLVIITMCESREFHFEGDNGLSEINLGIRAAFACNMGCRRTSQPSEGAASSFHACVELNPPPPLLCIITAGENKCCDISLFNPLSSEKCILSRSNLLPLAVRLHFCSGAEAWNYSTVISLRCFDIKKTQKQQPTDAYVFLLLSWLN